MPVAVVVDTTSAVCRDLLHQHNLVEVSNIIIWDGKEYRDQIDIKVEDFLTRLETSSTFPTTAAAHPHSFRETFERLISEGNDVLVVVPTAAISSVPQNAMLAASEVKNGKVRVAQSNAFGMSAGWMAVLAARAAAQGADLDACYALVNACRGGIVGFVNQLDLLRASGRANRLQTVIGTGLKLKPILETRPDGTIDTTGRVRTRSRAIQALIDRIVERVDGATGEVYIAVHHIACEEDAHHALEQLKQKIPITESIVCGLTTAPACHFGPGALGITYVLAGV